MGDLTANLSRHEFACQCGCSFDTVDCVLVNTLQELVDVYKQRHDQTHIEILSGCRCVSHNNDAYGSPNSQHLYGRAADFKIWMGTVQVAPGKLHLLMNQWYSGRFGLGWYETFNHLDTRTAHAARWQG